MADATPRDEVLEAESRRCRALESGDLNALGALLAPGYRHVHGNGVVERRDEYLSRLGGGGSRRVERSDIDVDVFDDVAAMSGISVTTVDPGTGAPRRRITGRALQLWRFEQGDWRQVAFQMTLTEPPRDITT